jgi:hypothetical protein
MRHLAPDRSEEETMESNSALAIEDVPLSDEVREFCERHVLFGHLAKALELARECFRIVGDPVISWEHDPENDDEYLVLTVKVQGTVSECVESNGRFLRAWGKVAALPEVRLIRLIPNLLEMDANRDGSSSV